MQGGKTMRKKKIWSRLVSGGLAFLTAAALWPAGNGDTVYAAGNTVTSETEKLTVNMGEQQGKILHGASGFLYGVSSSELYPHSRQWVRKRQIQVQGS